MYGCQAFQQHRHFFPPELSQHRFTLLKQGSTPGRAGLVAQLAHGPDSPHQLLGLQLAELGLQVEQQGLQQFRGGADLHRQQSAEPHTTLSQAVAAQQTAPPHHPSSIQCSTHCMVTSSMQEISSSSSSRRRLVSPQDNITTTTTTTGDSGHAAAVHAAGWTHVHSKWLEIA
jgi:hypothetical protein